MANRWEDLGVAVSYVCGWLYFLAWSMSFYPQPYLNIRRRTTQGLTPDFPFLNVVGFSCYSISVLTLLYSPTVRSEYAARHPASPEPTVRFNDAAFGVHALVLCIITYSQFWPRLWGWTREKGVGRHVLKATLGVFFGAVLGFVVVLVIVLTHDRDAREASAWGWLDLIYALQYIKLLLTVFKYVPQVVSNFRRKSTAGWSIVQVNLDLSGGIFSLVQLVIDSALQADWSGLAGNPVKLGLANISMLFDLIFIVQHYLLFGPVEEKRHDSADGDRERDPLIA